MHLLHKVLSLIDQIYLICIWVFRQNVVLWMMQKTHQSWLI